jgi:hypothetical protein
VLSRSPHLHSRRGAFLVDAQAVIGALRKGRSSAPTLMHPIRRVAALCLACDWTWRFHYVPSESNAADWPSRGLAYKQQKARQRRRVQQGHSWRLGRVRQYSKLERALTRHSNQVKFVRNLDSRPWARNLVGELLRWFPAFWRAVTHGLRLPLGPIGYLDLFLHVNSVWQRNGRLRPRGT